MPRIHKLSLQEAQKIAAGEVVERPANVVKELIENALDAGATHITIYIEDGGKQLIRVVDNGCGMCPEDARLCLEQYATSKISSIDDLTTLTTFGFRGEALAAICAVSKVTVTTKEDTALNGLQLTVEAGTLLNEQTVASLPGTDITITDLFYNVPARRKFLKTRETEIHQIQLLLQAFCFVYHHVRFQLFHDDKLIYNCPVAPDILTRFAQLWDLHHAAHMLTINAREKGITLHGAISLPSIARYDRSHIFCFINNRWIKNSGLSKAIIKGYMNVLPPGKFPAACIALTIDPHQIDVNVHPRKEEVQCMHPRILETLITATIKNGLAQHLAKQVAPHRDPSLSPAPPSLAYSWQPSISTPENPSFVPQQITTQHPMAPTLVATSVRDVDPLNVAAISPFHNAQQDLEKQQEITTLPEFHLSNLIGQLKKTYLLLEHEQGMFLVDQHAAHERILYEQFASRFHEIATVKLLFAHTVHVTTNDLTILIPHLSLFEQYGIALEPISTNQLIVQSLPVHLNNKPIDDLIHLVIGLVHEYQGLEKAELTQQLNEKLRAQMACKAAVKAGDVLTREHMEQLLTDLSTCHNRFTCPHGRPTGWLLELYEIEKKFKRKL